MTDFRKNTRLEQLFRGAHSCVGVRGADHGCARGPNGTTFVYPAEVFPSDTRTTGHGIASATGKKGAFIGVFLFPVFMSWHGLLAAESAAAIVSILGALVTFLMLPETKGKKLEELNEDAQSGQHDEVPLEKLLAN